jgi:hypothetical protein
MGGAIGVRPILALIRGRGRLSRRRNEVDGGGEQDPTDEPARLRPVTLQVWSIPIEK